MPFIPRTTQEGNGEGMNGREMTEEDERRIKFQAEVQFSCDCCHSYWVIAIMDQQKVEDICPKSPIAFAVT